MNISPIAKLQQLILDDYDIGIPEIDNDTWIIIDPEDNIIGEGETLEEAILNIDDE